MLLITSGFLSLIFPSFLFFLKIQFGRIAFQMLFIHTFLSVENTLIFFKAAVKVRFQGPLLCPALQPGSWVPQAEVPVRPARNPQWWQVVGVQPGWEGAKRPGAPSHFLPAAVT